MRKINRQNNEGNKQTTKKDSKMEDKKREVHSKMVFPVWWENLTCLHRLPLPLSDAF